MMMTMPDSWCLLTGECLDALATLEPDSVDACVTDPPYGISFMGREWDTFKPHTVDADGGSQGAVAGTESVDGARTTATAGDKT